MEITLTDEQIDICDTVKNTDKSIQVEAYAGTAKTTTIQYAAPGFKAAMLAIAFNKKNADEFEKRLPPSCTNKTVNALGHGAILRANPRIMKPFLDDRKVGKIINQITSDRKISLAMEQWDQVKNMVNAAMTAGITPKNMGEPLTEDTPENWSDLIDCDEEDFPFLYDLAHETLEVSISLAYQGTISFKDQVYFSTCISGSFLRYPVVIVDESQDLALLDHKMLEKSLRPESRLMTVGDSLQAIYAWRGADAHSMKQMKRLRPEETWVDKKLTLTFRCPKVIVDRQQAHAPGYRAHRNNKLGAFHLYHEGWDWETIGKLAELGNVAVLCRANAPLLSLAFKLIRRGIGCEMLGRDLGRGLMLITKKMAPNDSTPIAQLLNKLEAWRAKEVAISMATDKPQRAERIDDQAESIIAVCDSADCSTAGDLRSAMDRLFGVQARNSVVVLSSIHRAKGMEWDLVIELDPFRLPSKYSVVSGGTALVQEGNLRYVSETRSKNILVNANLEHFA